MQQVNHSLSDMVQDVGQEIRFLQRDLSMIRQQYLSVLLSVRRSIVSWICKQATATSQPFTQYISHREPNRYQAAVIICYSTCDRYLCLVDPDATMVLDTQISYRDMDNDHRILLQRQVRLVVCVRRICLCSRPTSFKGLGYCLRPFNIKQKKMTTTTTQTPTCLLFGVLPSCPSCLCYYYFFCLQKR